jgi:hypothetical protein
MLSAQKRAFEISKPDNQSKTHGMRNQHCIHTLYECEFNQRVSAVMILMRRNSLCVSVRVSNYMWRTNGIPLPNIFSLYPCVYLYISISNTSVNTIGVSPYYTITIPALRAGGTGAWRRARIAAPRSRRPPRARAR